MQVTVTSRELDRLPGELLVVPLFRRRSDEWRLPPRVASLDRALGGDIAAVLESGDFRGGRDESLVIYPRGDSGPTRVMLYGLGDERPVDPDALRGAAAAGVKRAAAKHVETVEVFLPSARGLAARRSAQLVAEGAQLGSYRFDAYHTANDDAPTPVRKTTLVCARSGDVASARAGAARGVAIGESQNLTRALVDEPGGTLPPAALADAARKMAREVGLRCQVFGERELERRNMNAILAVGRGSERPPRLITLEHNAPARGRGKKAARKRPLPTLCLVGKGITFDSGGISIKPALGMHEMKDDMGGAAAVVGAMRAAALLKIRLHVVGVIASAENLPSGSAYRPGDIVRSMSGKTIEVLNTDAEGRVVLADALHFARTEYAPEAMVDLATLTGACKVALGPWASGVFGTDERLIERVRRAGDAASELMWQLPLLDEHREAVKSPFADLKNTAGRDAGASTAAAFLAAFVGDTPWVHLDIAGTVWADKAGPVHGPGATGVGVRTLVELMEGWKGRSRD